MPQSKRKKSRFLSNKFRVGLFNDTTHEKLFGFRAKGTVMLVVFAIVVARVELSESGERGSADSPRDRCETTKRYSARKYRAEDRG